MSPNRLVVIVGLVEMAFVGVLTILQVLTEKYVAGSGCANTGICNSPWFIPELAVRAILYLFPPVAASVIIYKISKDSGKSRDEIERLLLAHKKLLVPLALFLILVLTFAWLNIFQ